MWCCRCWFARRTCCDCAARTRRCRSWSGSAPRNSPPPIRTWNPSPIPSRTICARPLLFVKDFATRLERDYGEQLDEQGRQVLQVIGDGCRSMDEMVVGLLEFSRATRQPLDLVQLDMTPIVKRRGRRSARRCIRIPRTVVEIGDAASGRSGSGRDPPRLGQPAGQCLQVQRQARAARASASAAGPRASETIYARRGQWRRIRHAVRRQAVRRIQAPAQLQ